jgi:hypothetical protein
MGSQHLREPMADYRFYHLARGRIMSAEVQECVDDETARLAAHAMLAVASPVCDAIEIWLLTRLVGIVDRAAVTPRT